MNMPHRPRAGIPPDADPLVQRGATARRSQLNLRANPAAVALNGLIVALASPKR